MARKTQPLDIAQHPQQQDSSANHAQKPADNLITKCEVVPAKIQPSPQEEQHRAAERDYWRRELRVMQWLNWITGVGTAFALAGLVGLYYTFSETRRQANVATQALYSQRPYVTLGREDGIVAEYNPPREGERKGTIVVYFRNAGPAPALSFIANVFSWWFPGSHGERHIERYKGIFPTGAIMYPRFPDVIIGANSTHSVVVDPKRTPYIDEWELIVADELENGFGLIGNFEYCDWWGKYHCSEFSIDYRPFPIGKFTC